MAGLLPPFGTRLIVASSGPLVIFSSPLPPDAFLRKVPLARRRLVSLGAAGRNEPNVHDGSAVVSAFAARRTPSASSEDSSATPDGVAGQAGFSDAASPTASA